MSLSVLVLLFLLSVIKGQISCTNSACDEVADLFNVPSFGNLSFQYYHGTSQKGIISYQPEITLAVIVVHSTFRDAKEYYCYLRLAAQMKFNNTDNIYIAAPHYIIVGDNPPPGTLFWDDNSGWKQAGFSTVSLEPRISSFEILDQMVLAFANKTNYPNLKHILVTGHSAGGQVTHRYALGNGVNSQVESMGITLRYVVANPSTYVYLDPLRPSSLPPPTCLEHCNSSLIPSFSYPFSLPLSSSVDNCPTYNAWKYGLVNMDEYMTWRSTEEIKTQYNERKVIYLLGTSDTCNSLFDCGCDDVEMDTGCQAELQGLCRYQRGWAYFRYLQNYYKNKLTHKLVEVPGVAHQGCEMFTSENGISALFDSYTSQPSKMHVYIKVVFVTILSAAFLGCSIFAIRYIYKRRRSAMAFEFEKLHREEEDTQ